MRCIVLPLILLFVNLFAISASAGPLADSLRAVEAKGFKSVTPEKLQQLLTVSVAKPGKIQFSRSWIDAQPKATGGRHWQCLSEALYFEARGETVKGQFAVAEVILNRVRSSRFPDNICGVINQGTGKRFRCQFTYTCDGLAETIHEPRAWTRVGKIARLVMDGAAPKVTNGATHYHTKAVNPRWSRVYTRTASIGVHLFYRHTYRTAKN